MFLFCRANSIFIRAGKIRLQNWSLKLWALGQFVGHPCEGQTISRLCLFFLEISYSVHDT